MVFKILVTLSNFEEKHLLKKRWAEAENARSMRSQSLSWQHMADAPALTLFHHIRGNQLIKPKTAPIEMHVGLQSEYARTFLGGGQ
ncbi:hypothetical protein RB195_006114 [Necator americanus]|uniref:Hexosyltransferase n=1 Tax=Necator americanus TaxID=51031 RepID=A0ABR1BUE3_NECAM